MKQRAGRSARFATPDHCRDTRCAVDIAPVRLTRIDMGHDRFTTSGGRIKIRVEDADAACELKATRACLGNVLIGGAEQPGESGGILPHDPFQPDCPDGRRGRSDGLRRGWRRGAGAKGKYGGKAGEAAKGHALDLALRSPRVNRSCGKAAVSLGARAFSAQDANDPTHL